MPNTPYPLPERLSPNLIRVHAYWESLKRAGNTMPFWDDVNLSVLPDLEEHLLLIDVFIKPNRFRLRFVGKEFGGQDANVFLDDAARGGPLAFLLSQSSATVEVRSPTHYYQAASAAEGLRRRWKRDPRHGTGFR